jgi:hypothetical protein
MRTLYLILALCCTYTAVAQGLPLGKAKLFANVVELLPDSVEVKGSTQGFAIYGRYGFSVHDKGECVVIDLKRKRFISKFTLEGNTGHCNNASFGVERYSEESPFPLLYVTECRGERACYVNDVTLMGSRMVQKICYDGKDATGPADWAVDRANRLIYFYCTVNNIRTLKWFALPRLADSDARGEVHLTDEDALGSVAAGDITIPQGSLIHRGRAYLPDGIPPRPTRLHVTDIESGASLATIDLSHTGLEPEGVAVRRRWLYLSYHTPRNARANVIYRLKIKR